MLNWCTIEMDDSIEHNSIQFDDNQIKMMKYYDKSSTLKKTNKQEKPKNSERSHRVY